MSLRGYFLERSRVEEGGEGSSYFNIFFDFRSVLIVLGVYYVFSTYRIFSIFVVEVRLLGVSVFFYREFVIVVFSFDYIRIIW